MLLRRYLMMAQQAGKGFELVYDAASGELPNSVEWLKYYAPFNNPYYKQEVVNNTLELTNSHIYEKNGFYPIRHEYATRCSISVEFKGAASTGVAIHLTDGMYSALGVIKKNSSFYVETTDVGHNRLINEFVTLKEINTFTVVKYDTYAEYYLNDKLLYTQTELFPIDAVSIGSKGSTAVDDPNGNGYFTQRRNAVGTAYGGTSSGNTTYITKITYKEW